MWILDTKQRVDYQIQSKVDWAMGIWQVEGKNQKNRIETSRNNAIDYINGTFFLGGVITKARL